MDKKTSPRNLDAKEVRIVKEAISQGGLRGAWEVGGILRKALGEELPGPEQKPVATEVRASYPGKGMAEYAKQLNNVVGHEALRQMRRFRQRWSEKDVRQAERAGMSYRDCLALFFFDGLAAREKDATERQKLINERRNLVRACGQARKKIRQHEAEGMNRNQARERLKTPQMLIADAKKKHKRKEYAPVRRLLDHRDAVLHRLRAAKARMEELKKSLFNDFDERYEKQIEGFERLDNGLEELFELVRERMEKEEAKEKAE